MEPQLAFGVICRCCIANLLIDIFYYYSIVFVLRFPIIIAVYVSISLVLSMSLYFSLLLYLALYVSIDYLPINATN
jgi:hypothetical protein